MTAAESVGFMMDPGDDYRFLIDCGQDRVPSLAGRLRIGGIGVRVERLVEQDRQPR